MYLITRKNDDDVERIPMYITDNWKENYPNYACEVWELTDKGNFKLIKNYETSLNNGMALYAWKGSKDPETTKPQVIYKYPNRTRRENMPKEVKNYLSKIKGGILMIH